MKGSFIEKLNYLLDEKQVSKRQFAEDLGINKNQLRRWETGSNAPMKRTVQVIADYFMVVPQSLVDPERNIEYTYVETPITADMSFLPLSEQEKLLLTMFRESSATTQFKMIQAVMNCSEGKK